MGIGTTSLSEKLHIVDEDTIFTFGDIDYNGKTAILTVTNTNTTQSNAFLKLSNTNADCQLRPQSDDGKLHFYDSFTGGA